MENLARHETNLESHYISSHSFNDLYRVLPKLSYLCRVESQTTHSVQGSDDDMNRSSDSVLGEVGVLSCPSAFTQRTAFRSLGKLRCSSSLRHQVEKMRR